MGILVFTSEDQDSKNGMEMKFGADNAMNGNLNQQRLAPKSLCSLAKVCEKYVFAKIAR